MAIAAAEPTIAPAKPWRALPVAFTDIAGWQADDHVQALACFRISARAMASMPDRSRAFGINPQALQRVGAAALALDRGEASDAAIARRFFEDHFRAVAVSPLSGSGFVTGYYEPEVEASPVRTARFSYPLYRRPDDLVDVAETEMPSGWDPRFRFGRRAGGRLVEYHDRAAIEAGALAGRGLELAWIESPVDGFFIHIQGSARLVLPGGRIERISYAAKSGHPFTAIGRVLVDRGELRLEDVTMRTIREWLARHPAEAAEVMAQNRSFIFFAETDAAEPDLGPVAAAGVQLTPGRSLAVDRALHAFGTPVFVATHEPLAGHRQEWRRLMIAQDTGSAIVGIARGDLFIGSGEAAGEVAGAIRHNADFFVLAPADEAKR